jgi:hypothetical protein
VRAATEHYDQRIPDTRHITPVNYGITWTNCAGHPIVLHCATEMRLYRRSFLQQQVSTTSRT